MTHEDYSKFAGKICKVVVKNYHVNDNGNRKSYIAMVQQAYSPQMARLGHPMDNGEMVCGRQTSPMCDIISIAPASKSETKRWLALYKEFHDMTMADKGYDACEEDLKDYALYDLDQYINNIHKSMWDMDNGIQKKIVGLLKMQGFAGKDNPLVLTDETDPAYGNNKYGDENGLTFSQIAKVVLGEDGILYYATQWDLDNVIDQDQALQEVGDNLSLSSLYTLLVSCKQQIELKLND